MNKSAINGNVVVIMSKSTNKSANFVVIMIHEQVHRRLQLMIQKYKRKNLKTSWEQKRSMVSS